MKMTEISKLLKLPISGIWRRIKNKEFPTYEIKDKNGYLFWSRTAVLAWKKENEKATKTAQN
jgi:predicted DNA-binding transcriptional regulator AlpA